MRKVDSKTHSAKLCIMELFTDKYGRAKKKPYYVSQITVLLEESFSDDIVYEAIRQLVKEHKLLKTTEPRKHRQKTVFLYHSEFANPKFKSSMDIHFKSICKLVDKYSNRSISNQYGDHLENLVKAELETQGFTIVDTHAKKYKNKEYGRSKCNLDIIAEHCSGKLTIGVEVKNTISILDKKEVDIKLDMCGFLGITPVFAVRWLKPYIKLIDDRGGFSWIFEKQLYPPSLDALTKTLNKRLHLPVNVGTKLPQESVKLFHNWVKNKTALICTET